MLADGDGAGAGAAGAVRLPARARTIDLGDATLMPGLIDAHTHILGRVLGDPKGDDASVRDYPAMDAILGVENARKTLMAGFTTIRNVGAGDFHDISLRYAIEEGKIPGPRIQAAAHSLAQCLRAEMRPSGVRVVNVFPGPIDDEWNQLTPPPKVAPAALARAMVKALQDGVEDVYPGDVAQEWLARWRDNPKALERELWA